jgi:coenzyme F420 hydrogenase subunit beta
MVKAADVLKKNVIDNGYCVGCGVCCVPDDSPFEMHLNTFGQYFPFQVSSFQGTQTNYLNICPFSNSFTNENYLNSKLYSGCDNESKNLGKYNSIYAGYVAEGNYRLSGSSGGFGTWILDQ